MRRDLTRREPAGSERQHDLVHAGQPPLPLLDDLRVERPVPISRHVDLDRADLGQNRLRPGAVAGVLADRVPVLLVAKMLGHLRLKRRLEDSLREPVQQPIGADEVNALFLGLLQQLLRELLLVDEPTAAVDRSRAGQLADLLHRVTVESGCVTVVATHDPEVVAVAAIPVLAGVTDGAFIIATGIVLSVVFFGATLYFRSGVFN